MHWNYQIYLNHIILYHFKCFMIPSSEPFWLLGGVCTPHAPLMYLCKSGYLGGGGYSPYKLFDRYVLLTPPNPYPNFLSRIWSYFDTLPWTVVFCSKISILSQTVQRQKLYPYPDLIGLNSTIFANCFWPRGLTAMDTLNMLKKPLWKCCQ